MAGPPASSTSIWTRKMDMFHIVFLFFGSVFLPLALDFVPYYPFTLPSWANALHEHYMITYNDPVAVKNPPFMKFFVFIEAVYSLPIALWSIRGLIKDDPMVPVHLLVFSTFYAMSTAVCFVELISTQDWPKEDIAKNAPGYVIFFGIAAVMWFDMFSRVKKIVTSKSKLS